MALLAVIFLNERIGPAHVGAIGLLVLGQALFVGGVGELQPGILILVLGAMGRQQGPGFDLGQRGGHYQEIPGKVNVHHLHPVQIIEILARDQGDRDIVDVHLVFSDKMQ